MTDTTKTAPTLASLRARRDEILALAARYGAHNVRVFGSVARGEATPDSDVDLLVDFRDGATLWGAVGLCVRQKPHRFIGSGVSRRSDAKNHLGFCGTASCFARGGRGAAARLPPERDGEA